MDDEARNLSELIRVGTVQAVDAGARKARVKFEDTGIISDWLRVLQHFAAGVYIEPDGEHAHTTESGGAASTEPKHDHTPSRLTYWMPKINDTVLTLYLPVPNGDGYILGGM